MARVTIGIDVGQQKDPTAIAVCNLEWRPPSAERASLPGVPSLLDHHIVRYLTRLSLGTTYPQISKELVRIVNRVQERVGSAGLQQEGATIVEGDYAQVEVYVDATGVGKPVVDEMRAAGVPVHGVYFTHGDKRIVTVDELTGDTRIALGKGWMVSFLQVRLQTNRIHLPRTPQAKHLAQELLDYEIKVSEKGDEQAGAFKVGSHDDLVTALGLAVQATPDMPGGAGFLEGYRAAAVPWWAGGGVDDGSGASLSIGNLISQEANRLLHGRGAMPNAWGADGGNGLEELGNMGLLRR